MSDLADGLLGAAGAVGQWLVERLPQWLGALGLLLLGWIVARLLRAAARRGAGALDALLARSGVRPSVRVGKASASVLGALAYWATLLFFITTAASTLGLQTFTDWLARLLDHVPTLAAGLLIIGAGLVLSGMVADLVRTTAKGLMEPQRQALARTAQVATLIVALLIGADQIGLKVTWLAILAAVLLAAVLGGMAVAVSLGARSYVGNLIGAHYLRQALQPGQRVRVSGHEGRILQVTPTSLVLECAEGRVMLPGRIFHDEAIVLVAREDDAVA